MNFQIKTQDLAKAARTLAPICTANKVSPTAGYMKLSQNGTTLKLTGTDLTVSAEYTLALATEGQGDCLVPPTYLLETLEKFKATEVVVSNDEKHLVLSAGRAHSELATRPVEDFPEFPKQDGGAIVKAKASDFVSALKAVAPSMSTNKDRYILNGIRMGVVEGYISLLATDGAQLGAAWVAAEGELDGITVPAQGIQAVCSAFAEAEDDIEIESNSTVATFSCGSRKIAIRLLDGRYPNCTALLELDHPNSFTVTASEFQDAIDLASVVAPGPKPSIKLELSPTEIHVSAIDANVGANETPVPVSESKTEENYIVGEARLSPRRLAKLLKAAQTYTDTVVIKYGTATSALLIHAKDKFRALVMPMSTK